MNEDRKTARDSIAKVALEQACGCQLNWTQELVALADGYCTTLSDAFHDKDLNPLEIHQLVASAVALVLFAGKVGWITATAFDSAHAHALQVRQLALRRFSGQLVVVKANNAGASRTTH
ncbi:hypothetical protein [Ralstonia pseudosolanacearum]|uniref:hypothetical protein n=1 Tax=Ralstonia pseudosolanacearum TaxID=1310165 RepID=UPI0008DA71CB|nr:hypothetical protein [Ralstonia pseudosolanacearum]MCL1618361.1 hypothetical protein [Ralstonia pseudosolanacearum CaRs-Mep]